LKIEADKREGTLPYWEWGFDVGDPSKSPLFDGSPTSMGSDGAYLSHDGYKISERIQLPPGSGGGCVERGPFSNMTVYLGPILLPGGGHTLSSPSKDLLKDNPRCLKRDLNGYPGRRWASFRNTTSLILDSSNIEIFQGASQGLDEYTSHDPGMGPHGGGHYMIGGDPGGDVYLSPGEPVFYLHHAQLDRAYWIWQNLDWENRQVSHIYFTSADPHQELISFDL
jgi:tyrosinase